MLSFTTRVPGILAPPWRWHAMQVHNHFADGIWCARSQSQLDQWNYVLWHSISIWRFMVLPQIKRLHKKLIQVYHHFLPGAGIEAGVKYL